MWCIALQTGWQMKLKEIKLNNLLNDKKNVRRDIYFFSFLMVIGVGGQASEENEPQKYHYKYLLKK